MINPNCNVICVVGGKGGVGKSVFSANLAVTLMREMRATTLLIDSDQKSCGDQNILLGLKPIKTFSEVAQFTGAINQQSLPQFVLNHQSGIQFLAAVRGPEESLNVSGDLAVKLLENLSQIYRFIVIDCGNELTSLQSSLMLAGTAVVVVTAPEVLVVNQTQRLIADLLTQTFPLDMIQLVVNKYTANALNPQTIAQSLRLQLLGIIPQDDVSTLGSIQRSTPFVLSSPQAPISASYTEIARKLTGGVLQKLKNVNRSQPTTASASITVASEANTGGLEARTLLRLKLHSELIKAMDLNKGLSDTQGDEAKEKQLRAKVQQVVTTLIDKEAPNLQRDDRSRMIKEVVEEAVGLGPLEDLLADNNISEIMVNNANKIYVEKNGRLTISPVTFTSNAHLRNVITRIVTPLGRSINNQTPYVDARLKDGSRVNAIIEPLALDGPSMTIRKFKKGGITAEKYVEFGSLTKNMIELLKICVENGLNIVISGGTGSGKTSLLNMMSSFIPGSERIITVEDAAELQMKQEHVVRLETRPPSTEGTGQVTIRDLIRNSLRMRPDRIVVGECRDGAALDMLQAMNTGHEGSMTTTHANSPRECIARLETLCMMSGMDLPIEAIRQQIASAVHLIVQVSRLPDGSRKVTHITEVQGLQGDVVTLQNIFEFKETGQEKGKIIGNFYCPGTPPKFFEKFEKKGVQIPRSILSNDAPVQKPNANQANPTISHGQSQIQSPGPAANIGLNPALAHLKKSSGGKS